MKITTKILIVLTLCCSFAGMIKADSGPLTNQTTFYFQQNGQAITQPVHFNIKCYGVSIYRQGEDIPDSQEGFTENKEEGIIESNKLLQISEMSETCLSYGCKFNTSNIFRAYRKIMKYCTLEGNINGQKFVIDKFLDNDLSGWNCRTNDYIIVSDDKYYNKTPQYQECRKNVYKEYHPQGNGGEKGIFVCDQYNTDDKLIPTDISTETYGPCYTYEYIIKNNICYQLPQEFLDCRTSKYQKLDACDQYIEDVTAKLAKDENGYPFEQICEIKINIPTNSLKTNNQPTQSLQQATLVKQPHKNIFNRIIDFFKYTFLQIFSKSY